MMIFPKNTQKPNRIIKIPIFFYAKNFIFWPLGKNLGRDLKLNINPVYDTGFNPTDLVFEIFIRLGGVFS